MLEKLFRPNTKLIEPYEEDFYHEPGTIPGTLNEDRDAPDTRVSLIDYNQNIVIPRRVHVPEDCTIYLDTESVSWVDVQGLGNTNILQRIGKVFELHPLVLEDVVNVPERPKIEDYEDQLVIISRMVMPTEAADGFHSEQVSFVLGKNYLLTVQEEPTLDCFDPVRLRIRNNKGIIRKQGADYLAYALLDAIIDGFFPVLEDYGERIEDLEEEVIVNPTRKTLRKIYRIRRELLQLRRAIWPQRSAINALIRDSNELIGEEVRIYLRDCYDHAVQVMDMVETYRELASGLMDVYLSAVSNRMNEIMKLLTVFSWIFLPLTFIAGLYGMNFEYMPGLKTPWGFWLCVAAMVAIAVGLLVFFRRSGWLESTPTLKDVRSERKF